MNKDTLYKLYITDDLSQRQVAGECGVSHSTIRHYLNKYNIKKNKSQPETSRKLKRCPSCDTSKPLTEFYRRSSRKVTRKSSSVGSWCKKCMTNQVVERQRRYKAEAVAYKGGCCQACGFDKYLGALEFHHLDPTTKSGDIVRFSKGPKDPIVKAELDKCVLLCANCHRMAHAGMITF